MTDDKDKLTDHNYDGIHELDNPLPDWWLFTFLGTIIFAFIYFIHYEFSGGQTIAEELQMDLAHIESIRASSPSAVESEEELAKLLSLKAVNEKGEGVYMAKCAACHGQKLEGLIGPNLTDDYWLHGMGKMVDIAALIRKGVLDKGMPKWDDQLSREEIQALTVFIASRAGSDPVNPKPPQGEKRARQ